MVVFQSISTDCSSGRLRFGIAVVVCLVALLSVPSFGAPVPCPVTDCPPFPREQDQLWTISTRDLCCSDDVGAKTLELKYSRYRDGVWQASSEKQFRESDNPRVRTVFLVHGHWTSHSEAQTIGTTITRLMVDSSTDPRPLRFVIWSWPATPSEAVRIIVNARIKAERSDLEAYLLADLLNRNDPRAPVSLIGFSLGARIISGALHLLSGGSIDSCCTGHVKLPDRAAAPDRRVRAVLLASTMDSDWLLPGERFSGTLGQMQHLLLLNNRCDRILKRYPRMVCSRRHGPQALGITGLYLDDLSEKDRAKIDQYDVCSLIGKSHKIRNYYCSDEVMSLVRRATLICHGIKD